MKKILVMMALVMVCLCCCDTIQKEETTISDGKVTVSEETKEGGLCSVDVISRRYYDHDTGLECYRFEDKDDVVLDSIVIKNAVDTIIGKGYYAGKYLVPHNGTMTIYWKNEQSVRVAYGTYDWRWIRHKYIVKVGSANHLEVSVDDESLYVGNFQVYEKDVD
jgi:hypothetical protein